MAGRKRSSKRFPSHIDREKLPKGIYWDSSGNGHWYISYFDAENRQRRMRVAGSKAALSDLHRIIEAQAGVPRDTFDFIAKKYFESLDYSGLAASTKRGHKLSFRFISNFRTKQSTRLGSEPLSKWSYGLAQKLLDLFAKERGPTAANHSARFARRVFNWARQRDYVNHNPFERLKFAKERQRRRLPSKESYFSVLEFSKTTGYRYLWAVMELAYLCRMRGIEVLDLSDANEMEDGLLAERRKGSRDNITKWNSRLRRAWDSLKVIRDEIYEKKGIPIPINKHERYIVVSRSGYRLTKQALDTAWQRVITDALNQGIISESERFSLHDLKRMGVTNTKGTRAEKQQASGHRSAAMLDVYDLEVPVVDAVEDD
ncbi:MAG: hypothetical protein ABW124_11065 [Candidatus Thiodiazotropha sp. 6PLUC9]